MSENLNKCSLFTRILNNDVLCGEHILETIFRVEPL